MTPEELTRHRRCAGLLVEPGHEVALGYLDMIERLTAERDEARRLAGVLARYTLGESSADYLPAARAVPKERWPR